VTLLTQVDCRVCGFGNIHGSHVILGLYNGSGQRPDSKERKGRTMVTKKELIGNELVKEIMRIRVDALAKMLELDHKKRLPKVYEEGATGELDNKGAIFVPGGLVLEDSDRTPIRKKKYGSNSGTAFHKLVRDCMQNDNATLLFQDGYVSGVNLDNGFFAEKSSQILGAKSAAGRRPKILERHPPRRIRSDDICKSLCPEAIPAPYGSRTKLSSCLAVCLTEPRLFYLECTHEYALRGIAARRVWERIRSTRRAIRGRGRQVLAPPYIVVCHQTRYRKNALVGMTRILGIGEFGEFATITLEVVTSDFAEELREKKIAWNESDIITTFQDKPVLAVIRIYPSTRPGARSRGSQVMLISCHKDLGFIPKNILRTAQQHYNLD
jgi:hypothetical protein